MSKTKSVLLLILVLGLAPAISAQAPENVTFKVVLVDKNLNLKPVPRFSLTVRKPADATWPDQKVSTTLEGVATLSVPGGNYVVLSEKAIDLEGRSYTWK